MKVIVDMRVATGSPKSFAIWDTSVDQFERFDLTQVFDGVEDLKECLQCEKDPKRAYEYLQRIKSLLPEWAK